MNNKFYLNILNYCDGELKNANKEAWYKNLNITVGKVNKIKNNSISDLIKIELEKNLLKGYNEKGLFNKLLDFLEKNSDKFNIFTTGLSKFNKKGENVFKRIKFTSSRNGSNKYENFCLIFQSKNLENIKFDKYEFNANSVQMVFDIFLKKEDINYELQRIHFMDYNSDLKEISDNDENMNLNKLSNYDIVFCCHDLHCGDKCKLENKANFKINSDTVLSWTKPIRYFEDESVENDEIKILETKNIINKFFDIYNKKSNNYNFYLINFGDENEILEKNLSDENKNKKFDFKDKKIYFWKQKEIGFETLDRTPVLSNEEDNTSSAVKISYSKQNENFNYFLEEFSEEIKKLNDQVQKNQKTQKEHRENILNLENIIKELQDNIHKTNNEIKEANDLKEIYDNLISKRKEFFDIQKEINKLSQELKNKNSKKDKKKNKNSLKEKYDELSKKSQFVVDEIKELEKNLTILIIMNDKTNMRKKR